MVLRGRKWMMEWAALAQVVQSQIALGWEEP